MSDVLTSKADDPENEYVYSFFIQPTEPYEQGLACGGYINALLDVEGMQQQIQAIMDTSPIPTSGEYIITDDSGFGDVVLDAQVHTLEQIHNLALLFKGHDERAVMGIIKAHGIEHVTNPNCRFTFRLDGYWNSIEEFAENYSDEVPDWLWKFVNWKELGESLRSDYELIEYNGGIVAVRK